MDTDRVAWVTPATVALTAAESRADQPDVAMGNGFFPGGSTPV